jgi:excisionase family DNA binding protein
MISDEILNIKEAADYLKVPISTVYRLAQKGEIPAAKVGKHWRFRKKGLEYLFEQKRNEGLTIDD